MTFVRIKSERGRTCNVVNPWPGSKVTVFKNGEKTDTVSGLRFTLASEGDDQIRLAPEE